MLTPEDRLTRLETSLRRLRLACGGLALALAGALATAAAPSQPRAITASEFVAKDGEYTMVLRPHELVMTGPKDAKLRLTSEGLQAQRGVLKSPGPPAPVEEISVKVSDGLGISGRSANNRYVSATLSIDQGEPKMSFASEGKLRVLTVAGDH